MASPTPPKLPPASVLGSAAPADARFRDAAACTGALWLFSLVSYLPVVIERHAHDGARAGLAVVLDNLIVLPAMLVAVPLFAMFRATLGRSDGERVTRLAMALSLAAIVQSVVENLYWGVVLRPTGVTWPVADLFRPTYSSTIAYLSTYAANVVLFQLAASTRRARRQDRLAAARQAELEALRFRLNPHFLFNTLNAISAMIVTQRTGEADRTVERLAAFLRAAQAYDPAATIPLEEELATADHYARIEETRFGDRLHIAVAVGPGLETACVPPLLLQPILEPLIEAASVGSTRAEVVLALREEGGLLRIEGTLVPAPEGLNVAAGAAAALDDRLRARFGALAGAAAEPRGLAAWMPLVEEG